VIGAPPDAAEARIGAPHPLNAVSGCRWTPLRACRHFGARPLAVDLLFQDRRGFEDAYATRRNRRLSAGFRIATKALLFRPDNERPERREFNGPSQGWM
jgi:hypothetical protein